jgi:hypothetical protein
MSYLQSDKNNRYFTRIQMKIFDGIFQFFLEFGRFGTNVVEKIKTHILGSVKFPSKSCRFLDNVEKKNMVETDRP